MAHPRLLAAYGVLALVLAGLLAFSPAAEFARPVFAWVGLAILMVAVLVGIPLILNVRGDEDRVRWRQFFRHIAADAWLELGAFIVIASAILFTGAMIERTAGMTWVLAISAVGGIAGAALILLWGSAIESEPDETPEHPAL